MLVSGRALSFTANFYFKVTVAESRNAAVEEDVPPVPPRYGSNLHAPMFVNFPLEVRVNEALPLGSVLVKVRARDRDLGYNGKLVFGVASAYEDSLFKMDLETGELRLVGFLDRKRESEYLLNVSVHDHGTPSKSAHRVLPITVLVSLEINHSNCERNSTFIWHIPETLHANLKL